MAKEPARKRLSGKSNYKKLRLVLDESGIKDLVSLIHSADNQSLKDALSFLTEAGKENKDEFIKYQVKYALSDLSGVPIKSIQDTDNLRYDLGLAAYHKRSLQAYFTDILIDLGSSKGVSVRECEACEKVSDCVKLLKEKYEA